MSGLAARRYVGRGWGGGCCGWWRRVAGGSGGSRNSCWGKARLVRGRGRLDGRVRVEKVLPCSEYDVIYVFKFSAVFEVYCSRVCGSVRGDVRDWWSAEDIWMLKCVVEEIWVVCSDL